MSPESQRRLAQIALMWGGRLGPMAYRRVVGHFGSPQAALAGTWEELALPSLRLDPEQIESILSRAQDLDHVRRVLARLAEQNLAVLCDWEPDYPAILREMNDAPPVLCRAGRLLPRDEPAVAIVGTRTPTPEGRQMAEALGRACAAEGITVVSGLALGCDTGAHVGALDGGGRTIAVLGSGILAISPRQNLDLAREIAEQGAVLSEAAPGAQPSAPRLLARNRLQVGLAQAVIVVQAGPSGGSDADGGAGRENAPAGLRGAVAGRDRQERGECGAAGGRSAGAGGAGGHTEPYQRSLRPPRKSAEGAGRGSGKAVRGRQRRAVRGMARAAEARVALFVERGTWIVDRGEGGWGLVVGGQGPGRTL